MTIDLTPEQVRHLAELVDIHIELLIDSEDMEPRAILEAEELKTIAEILKPKSLHRETRNEMINLLVKVHVKMLQEDSGQLFEIVRAGMAGFKDNTDQELYEEFEDMAEGSEEFERILKEAESQLGVS